MMAHVQEKLIKLSNKNRTSIWSYICKCQESLRIFQFWQRKCISRFTCSLQPSPPSPNLQPRGHTVGCKSKLVLPHNLFRSCGM